MGRFANLEASHLISSSGRGRFYRCENCLTIETDFHFSINDQGDVVRPIVTVDCEFEARYALVEGFEPSESQIEAFQSANAVFNCWPFFREYVQNIVVRMNFPPPPVPFLRIVRKSEDPAKSVEQPSPTLGAPGHKRKRSPRELSA